MSGTDEQMGNGHDKGELTRFALSFFSGKKDNRAKLKQLTWDDLVEMVGRPEVRETKDGPLFSPAVFDRDKRAKENVKEICALLLDHDHQADFDRDTQIWTALGVGVIAYTTYSHLRPPDNEVKFRVFIPLSEPIPRDDYPLLWRWAAEKSPSADPAAKDSSRIFYIPSRASNDDSEAPYRKLVQEGAPLDWRPIVEAERQKDIEAAAAKEAERERLRIARESKKNESRKASRNAQKNAAEAEERRIHGYVSAAIEGELYAVSFCSEGGRNNQLFQSAARLGSLLHFGVISYSEAFTLLTDAGTSCGLKESEVQPTVTGGLNKGERDPAQMPEPDLGSLDAYQAKAQQVYSGGKVTNFRPDRVRFPAEAKQDFHKLGDRVWKAIADLERETPMIFRHLGALVRCAPRTVKGREVLSAEPLTIDMLSSRLIHAFDWIDVDRKTGTPFMSYPPPMLPKMMLSDTEDQIPIKPPELIMIAHAPVFARNGRLIDKPGFDRESGVFYLPNDDFGQMPEKVTEEDVNLSKDLIINKFLGEFPFATDSDRHNAIGMIITFFVRQMISGRVPAFLAEASVQGAGKGTLVDGGLRVAFGRGGGHGLTTYTTNEEEMRKELTTHLVECRSAVVIDNLVGEVKSATLAAVLTADVWTQRLLGGNKTSEVTDPQTVWILTGNNPSFSQDNTRRIIPIRLTPDTDRPELREFKNPLFIEWVLENRVSLVKAFITLVRNWQQKGSQPGGFSLNSFVSHSRIISGILDAAGLNCYGQNLLTFSQRADTERNVRSIFCNAWFQEFQESTFLDEKRTRRMTATEILKTVGAKIEGLPIRGETDSARAKSFGGWLEKSEGMCPQYVGANWEYVTDPDAPTDQDRFIDSENEKRWGKPVNVRRSFKIARDGQKKHCTAWVLSCLEEGGFGGFGGFTTTSVREININAPQVDAHIQDAHTSHGHTGACTDICIEAAIQNPPNPPNPPLAKRATEATTDFPQYDDSQDPDYEPPF